VRPGVGKGFKKGSGGNLSEVYSAGVWGVFEREKEWPRRLKSCLKSEKEGRADAEQG